MTIQNKFNRWARAVTVGGIVAATAPAMVGCVTMSGCVEQARFTGSKSLTQPHVPGGGLVIDNNNGAVEVLPSDSGQLEVTAQVRALTQERLDAATLTTSRNDAGDLVVAVAWPEGKRHSNEAASLTVRIPDASRFDLRTSNGRITLGSLSGAAELRTSNGAIEVARFTGPINAKTTNGRIEIVGATEKVSADTSNGAINLALAPDNAGPVLLSTSNGAVTLTVGPAFKGTLEVDTSNGRISNSAPAGWWKGTARKSAATYTFGEGGAASSIDTSNGSVTVQGHE